MKNLFYRNPDTGLLEMQEDSFRPTKAYQWNRGKEGGILSDKPVEFASDSQLGLLRIADPVATALVQGFTATAPIGDKIFTPVRMARESGRFPAFGKEAFFIPANIKRAIGEKVQRVQTQSGYVQQSLSEYALGVTLENRERNEWAGAPDMLLNMKLNVVTSKISRYREKLQAILATTNANYLSGLSTSGAAKAWGSTGDAVKDMLDLILLVQSYNGVRPNVVWFSPAAWALWRRNKSVIDLLKYQGDSNNPARVTVAGTAALLEVQEVLIGYEVSATDTATVITDGGVKKSAPVVSYLWDSVQSANAGVCIRGTGGGIEPAFGYTWERMNSPVIESYYDNATKSQVWDYEHFFDPAVTLSSAGGQYYSLA